MQEPCSRVGGRRNATDVDFSIGRVAPSNVSCNPSFQWKLSRRQPTRLLVRRQQLGSVCPGRLRLNPPVPGLVGSPSPVRFHILEGCIRCEVTEGQFDGMSMIVDCIDAYNLPLKELKRYLRELFPNRKIKVELQENAFRLRIPRPLSEVERNYIDVYVRHDDGC